MHPKCGLFILARLLNPICGPAGHVIESYLLTGWLRYWILSMDRLATLLNPIRGLAGCICDWLRGKSARVCLRLQCLSICAGSLSTLLDIIIVVLLMPDRRTLQYAGSAPRIKRECVCIVCACVVLSSISVAFLDSPIYGVEFREFSLNWRSSYAGVC